MSVNQSPRVLDEWTTWSACCMGRSLARLGKAEVALLQGTDDYFQAAVPALVTELRALVRHDTPACLIGIPRVDAASPKAASAQALLTTLRPWLNPTQMYGSAYVSRPDIAPWIQAPAYLARLMPLWQGKRLALVCPPGNPLCWVFGGWAHKVKFIACPSRDAYHQIAQLEAAVHASQADLAILSCGATATCLAFRLAQQGCQALDVGHLGHWLLAQRTQAAHGTLVVLQTQGHSPQVVQATLEQAGYPVVWMSETAVGNTIAEGSGTWSAPHETTRT